MTGVLAQSDDMVEIPRGTVGLRDAGSNRRWNVDVRPFLLARFPVVDEPRGVPKVDVSWYEAVDWCNRLSSTAGLSPAYSFRGQDDDVTCDFHAEGYRLPTEAEWEHACRAGSAGERYGALDDIAWHAGNSGSALHEVGRKAPNAWGLHDMVGNAWEWCWDLFDPQTYGPYRIFRGGGFDDRPEACRASSRRKSHPSFRIDDLGFRVARTVR